MEPNFFSIYHLIVDGRKVIWRVLIANFQIDITFSLVVINSESQTDALSRLNSCLNKAAHGADISDPKIKLWIQDTSPRLIGRLDEVVKEQSVKTGQQSLTKERILLPK